MLRRRHNKCNKLKQVTLRLMLMVIFQSLLNSTRHTQMDCEVQNFKLELMR